MKAGCQPDTHCERARDFGRTVALICIALFAGSAVICIRIAIVAGNF